MLYINMANDPHAIPSLASSLASFLQELKPYVESRGHADDMLVDNACSAVSKIMISLTNNHGNTGLVQALGRPSCVNIVTSVLPTLLASLPLCSDREEDGPVYVQCLGNVLQTQPTLPAVVEHLPRIVFVFVKALKECEKEDVKKSILMRLKYACTQIQGAPNPAALVQGLDQGEVSWLERVLSGQEQ
jgi:hypothetical protein